MYNPQYHMPMSEAALIGENLGYYSRAGVEEPVREAVINLVDLRQKTTKENVCRVARRLGGYKVQRVGADWFENGKLI